MAGKSVAGVFTLCSMVMLVLAFSRIASAQQGSNKVYLNHADSLVGFEIHGEPARRLIGNVKFTHGATVVTCNRAIQYLASDRIELEGEVVVTDDTLTMVANRGIYRGDERTAEGFERVRLDDGNTVLRAQYGKYYTQEKKAYFHTNVFVEDPGSRMTANELTYFREEQKSIADGSVRIVNKADNTTILGEHFENYKKQQFSVMSKRPRVIQVDTSAGGEPDTLFLTSDVLESFQDSTKRLVATDNVFITRSDMTAEAGICVFHTELDSIELLGSPIVWHKQSAAETTQVTGDSIFVRLPARRLERVYVRGNAMTLSEADSLYPARYNQMTGMNMTMHFADGAITQVDVNGTATMLYYLFDGFDANGLNKTSGDAGVISFRDRKIDAIKVSGGVQGEYVPENLVRGKEMEFNLPGFSWRPPRFTKPSLL